HRKQQEKGEGQCHDRKNTIKTRSPFALYNRSAKDTSAESDERETGMSVPTIFDLCEPRADVRAGTSSESDFAADLSHVIRGKGGPIEYSDPARFFANTYPTRGLRSLLANVCTRLTGKPGAAAAIFHLDTSFGGGKTHGLIALVHAARGMSG